MFDIFQLKAENLGAHCTVRSTNEMMTRVEDISKSNDLYGGDLFELTDVMVQLLELSQNNSECFTVSDAEDLSNVSIEAVIFYNLMIIVISVSLFANAKALFFFFF